MNELSDKSKIEWCDASWNPVTGCTKVSEGCRNCYAEKFAERFRGTEGHYFENGFDIVLRPDKLDQPLKWTKPRKIFVNSMSDMFHEDIPDEFIWDVFQIMAKCPQHTFQVLTKRPERMMKFLSKRHWRDFGEIHALILEGKHRPTDVPCLPNVWLGTSVENQKAVDERIHFLNKTPAAVRFLSCEPLLGPLDLSSHLYWKSSNEWTIPLIDWVIVGGESGPKARPMYPEWARSIRDQCMAAGVSFFFKQWGEWLPNAQEYGADPGNFNYERKHVLVGEDQIPMCKAGKNKAGRFLDGREWNEFPEVQ